MKVNSPNTDEIPTLTVIVAEQSELWVRRSLSVRHLCSCCWAKAILSPWGSTEKSCRFDFA